MPDKTVDVQVKKVEEPAEPVVKILEHYQEIIFRRYNALDRPSQSR